MLGDDHRDPRQPASDHRRQPDVEHVRMDDVRPETPDGAEHPSHGDELLDHPKAHRHGSGLDDQAAIVRRLDRFSRLGSGPQVEHAYRQAGIGQRLGLPPHEEPTDGVRRRREPPGDDEHPLHGH